MSVSRNFCCTTLACAGMLALWSACGSAANPASDAGLIQNQIFQSTSSLTAAAGSATGGTPAFSWTATDRKHVVCAVFSAHISVSNNLITNSDKVVWIWDSGLSTGREGNVQYSDGVRDPVTKAAPVPLASGTYYWAVWAFDNEGVPSVSTPEMTLTVP